MTEDERQALQAMIATMHGRFVDVVARGRQGSLSLEQVKELADGRIFTAEQALQAKLIDRVGYLRDAVAEAKGLARLDAVQLVLYTRRPDSVENVYSPAQASASGDAGVMELARRVLSFRLYYLWEPVLFAK
jgi:protease-4